MYNDFWYIFLGKELCAVQEFLWLEKLLSKMAEDRDSRVRIAAVKGLSAMAASGRLLSFSIYQQVKNVCFYNFNITEFYIG